MSRLKIGNGFFSASILWV